MLQDNVFIARQPILNRYQELYAFELLFREGTQNNNSNGMITDMQATSRVLVNVLNTFGVNQLIGNKKGFVNIDEDFLRSNFFDSMDKEKFIFEILEDVELDAELALRVRNLAADGYQFALDDFVFNDKMIKNFKSIFDIIKYVKIDLIENNKNTLGEKIKLFKPYTVSLLAEKVETQEDFKLCKQLGFDYFQGYFFAKPKIVKGKNIDPERMAIMEMVRLLQRDPNVEEIVEAFKLHPDLTINLLRFINSAAIFTRNRINSVHQAVALIGQKQLMQWLLLMMYAGRGDSKGSTPLFVTASQRAKTMETLLKEALGVNKPEELDEAFLVGILSLLGSLFQIPEQDILMELNIDPDLQQAITKHSGRLGQLLLLVEKSETQKTIEMSLLMNKLRLSMKDVTSAAIKSYQWTSKINL